MKFRFPKLTPKFRRSEEVQGAEKSLPQGVHRRRCNLCHGFFRAASRFLRFCKSCRSEEELYRFSEWLRV